MFVRDCMSTPATTVTPDTPFQVALKTMQTHRFRRLPVVDKKGRLAGIVSERDLLHAAPSPVSSLSIGEMNYLLARLTVGQIMTRSIIITTPDTPVEHAASLMVANKVGGLPVVDEHDNVIGMITETDIFKVFVEMMDGKEGVRLTFDLPTGETVPFAFLQGIYDRGGKISAMGSIAHTPSTQRLVIVIRDRTLLDLHEPIRMLGDCLVDAYELSDSYVLVPPLSRVNGHTNHALCK